MKSVLIIGGAGFLGSHLARYFLSQERNVKALNDLSSASYINILEFSPNSMFGFIKQDVRKPLNVLGDDILNVACLASPIQYQSDPVKKLETNVLGMSNVLQLAVKN